MGMRLTVDLNVCQGYVCCVMAAPTLFDVDDDARAVVRHGEVSEELRGAAEAAARACPARAITVETT